MAIDIDSEQLLAIADVPAYLQKRTGKRPHVASVYRWLGNGLQGVKLESICIGGARLTSHEALSRFFARTTEAKQSGHSQSVKTGMNRAKIAREKQLDREASELGI